MEHSQSLVKNPHCPLNNSLFYFLWFFTVEACFYKLDVPITEVMPDEIVEDLAGFVDVKILKRSIVTCDCMV